MEAGLSEEDVETLSLHFDRRRKTVHPFNIELLKKMKEEAMKAVPEVGEAPPIEETKMPHKEKPVVKKEKPKEKKEKKPEEKKAKKETKVEKKGKGVPLTELKGVGKKKAEEFTSAGIKDIEDLLTCNPARIAGKTSFSEEYIAKLKKEAESL